MFNTLSAKPVKYTFTMWMQAFAGFAVAFLGPFTSLFLGSSLMEKGVNSSLVILALVFYALLTLVVGLIFAHKGNPVLNG